MQVLCKHQNPLGIKINDIVKINFSFRGKEEFLATVTKIGERADIGQDAYIEYERLDNVEVPVQAYNGCSVSHVSEIVEAAPYVVEQKQPINRFREHEKSMKWGLNISANQWKTLRKIWSYFLGTLRRGYLS